MAVEGNTISEADWNAALTERESQTQNSPPVETPPNEPKVEEQQPVEQASEQTPAAETTTEPATPALDPALQAKLAEFDKMAALFPQLVNELNAAKGRIGKMQSDWDKARAAAEQPSQTQIAAAAKDPERWAELKKDFPEWGDAITDFVDSRLGSVAGGKGPTAEEIEQLVAQRTAGATAQLEAAFNEKLVTMRHPGWKDTVKTDDFKTWFEAQDAATKALAESTDGLDAIRMLDLFVEAKKKPVTAVREERQSRLAAAATPARPAQAGSVTKSFDEMTPQEQWNHLAAQREKQGS